MLHSGPCQGGKASRRYLREFNERLHHEREGRLQGEIRRLLQPTCGGDVNHCAATAAKALLCTHSIEDEDCGACPCAHASILTEMPQLCCGGHCLALALQSWLSSQGSQVLGRVKSHYC